MAPLDFQPHKYLTNKTEQVIHSYSPSWGGSVVDDPTIIDNRILTAIKNGASFTKLDVQLTNKRILFNLIIQSFRQQVELCYQDLLSIDVGTLWGMPFRCVLKDSRGVWISLDASRPHFVAVELWVQIAHIVANNNANIKGAHSLITQIDVSSLKVPDDFLSCQGAAYSTVCSNFGFCLPINQPPYWKFSTALKTGAITLSPDDSNESLAAPHQPQATTSEMPTPIVNNVVTSPTAIAVGGGEALVEPGSLPIFKPSLAEMPATTQGMDSSEDELLFAIHNSPIYFQSFYNDLTPLTADGFNDDVISANCFDEDLYCALVREMHRYTLAEVSANQDQIAQGNAGLGAMVGSFLGLITGNIFAPFLGHTYGKNMTDRSRRIEEFLPDPKLLFNQDGNSYLSWSRGQVSSPRLRRLIIDRQIDSNGGVYFRLLPAIVTADSVYPIQLFKLDPSSYFYRPLAAGIGDDVGRNQPNYDPIKIQRKYFHIRAEGDVNPTDISLKVYGRDIEDYSVRLYRYTGHSLDYFYADFKIQPGSVF